MAALSADELANVANAALDFYIDKGTVYANKYFKSFTRQIYK